MNEIPSINEFLKNTSITEKTLKTYYLALDKFIPFLLNRFKENYDELKEFDLNGYYGLNTEQEGQFKKDLESKQIYNKLFEETWKTLNPNTKASLLMKWVEETHGLNLNGKNTDLRNTYLNYAWRVQGFLGKLGFEYSANPKNMEKVKSNGFHLSEDITYEDVIQLYERIDNTKFKYILKIIMYCGLNPIDVVLLKPKDFKRYRNTNYYVLVKARIKTKKKDVQYLITFHKHFIEELTAYFERNIPKTLNKNNQKEEIGKLRKDPHFKIIKDYENTIKLEGSYNWKKDSDRFIFNGTTSNNVIDAFKYHIGKNNLNSEVMSSSIRRLCFTLIKKVFTLADSDIYNLWTQHKEGILTRNYITDLVDRTIEKEYVEKISEKVLIGNVEKYIREVKDLKNGMNRVRDLENMVFSLLDVIKPKKSLESLESELKELEEISEIDYEREMNKYLEETDIEGRKYNIASEETHEYFKREKLKELEQQKTDLIDDIEQYKKLEQLESKFKTK